MPLDSPRTTTSERRKSDSVLDQRGTVKEVLENAQDTLAATATSTRGLVKKRILAMPRPNRPIFLPGYPRHTPRADAKRKAILAVIQVPAGGLVCLRSAGAHCITCARCTCAFISIGSCGGHAAPQRAMRATTGSQLPGSRRPLSLLPAGRSSNGPFAAIPLLHACGPEPPQGPADGG